MKGSKRALLLVLTLAAALGFFAIIGSMGSKVMAGSEIKMVRAALELYVGETDKLILSGDGKDAASWKSSDSGIVTVDGSGNVKGIAVGTAEITAEYGGTTAVCKVFVVEKEYSFDDDIMISVFWPPTQEYINDEQYKYMADAGITYVMGSGDNLGAKDVQLKMLELCYKYGIRMTVGDNRLGSNLLSMSEEKINKVVEEYRNVPAANGYYMLDEPYNPNTFINAYRILKNADPNSYMHLNFLPYASYGSVVTYKAQMNDWVKLCAQTGYKQDYLMYDLYPFGLEAGSMNRTGFLLNLNAVREVGLANDVKTGTYIQSVTQSVAFRSPTESETRYEINMALAFGIKQLSYFTWFTPYNRSEPFEDGIISYDGIPNPKYEFICRLNKEVKMLGPTLAKCDSLEVYQSSNGQNAMERIPEDFFVQRADKSDFTVAYLRHKETGRNYCMVVNNNFSKKKTFSLKFAEEISSLEYLSEKDGKIYAQEMGGDNTVTFDLDAGAARLFILPEGYDFSEKRVWTPEARENLALHAQVYCDTSSGSNGWYMCYLNDGQRFSDGTSNGWQADNKAGTAVVLVDFERELTFNRIDLYPAGDRFDYGTYMPADFAISISVDGENWYKLASAEGFATEGTAVPSIRFDTVKARYIRIIISKANGKKIQIAEIEVYNDDGSVGEPGNIIDFGKKERGSDVVKYKAGASIAKGKNVKVSSYPADGSYKSWGWWPDFLVDGTYNKGWTSNVKAHMDTASATEYAIIDLGDNFMISSFEVFPLGCWPKDFEVRVSIDQSEWTVIDSQKSSKKPSDSYEVTLEKPVAGRYFMFIATKLTRTEADGYMLQLAEIAVYGTPYKDEQEARKLMEDFVSAGGSVDSDLYKDVAGTLADANATQSQLDSKMKAMLESVGLSLPQAETASQTKADYKFVIEDNPLSNVDDTPVPTADPNSGNSNEDDDNNGDNSDNNTSKEQSSKGSRAAAIIAGLGIAAGVAAVAAVILIKKKKTERTE